MVYLAGARAEEVLSMSRASSSEASTRVEEVSLALVAKAMSLLPETPTSATRIAALEQRAALQLAMGRRGDARADVAALLQLARGLMGDDHPRVARLAANAALMWSRAWQPDAALPHLREAERVLARHAASPIAPPGLPMLGLELAAIRRALGLAHLEAGERALGVPLLTAARAASASAGDSSSLESATALALAHLDAHRAADARAVLQAELAAQLTSLPPDHAELAVVHYNLAVALRELGQLAPAADHAARAVALYQAAGQADLHRLAVALASQIAVRRGQPELALQWTAEVLHSPSASDPLALAWPRLERARALIALERDLPEARRLLLEARQISQIGGNAGARRAEIEQLLHALPAPKGGK